MTDRLIIPGVPSPALSSNSRSRGNKWTEREATASERAFAAVHARELWIGRPMLTGPLEAVVTLWWPSGRRRYDVDSLASLCKPYLDGLQGIVMENDSQIQRITYQQGRLDMVGKIDTPQGRTVIDFRVFDVEELNDA